MSKIYKLVLVGHEGVGKTCLVNRIMYNTFQKSYATIGALFVHKTLCICNDNNCSDKRCEIKFDIWDTAGQERFSSLVSLYYRNAGVIFMVFSYDDFDISWKKLIALYKEVIHDESDPKFIFIGTKIDLIDEKSNNIKINDKIIDDFVTDRENILGSFKTSSKMNIGFDEIYKCLKDNVKKNIIKSKDLSQLQLDNTPDNRCCWKL